MPQSAWWRRRIYGGVKMVRFLTEHIVKSARRPCISGYKSVWGTLFAVMFGLVLNIAAVRQTSAQASLIRFSPIRGSLNLKYMLERHLQPLNSSHPYFKETLTLRNKGFFVSPKILDFEWGIILGLSQDRYTSETFKRKSNGKIINGFFTGTFFKRNHFPLTFIWNRTSQNLIFDYGGYTSYDIEKFQVNWVLSRFFLSGLLSLEDRRTKENWYQFNRVSRRDLSQQIINYSGSRKGANSELNVRYKLRNIKDHIRDIQSNLFNNFHLTYNHYLNAKKTSVWNNSFSFFNRINKYLNYTTFNAEEGLKLKHPYGFSSDYSYRFSNTITGEYKSFIHAGHVSLQHQLFLSLTSQVALNGILQKTNQGNEKSYSFSRGLTYNKRLPFGSKLQIVYKQMDGKTDRSVKDVIIKKIGETHLIFNENPVFLDERNIIPQSIVVYNQEGDIYYEEGETKDYVVETIGDLTQIIRTPFSRIRPEQTILVDYEYRALPSLKYTTTSHTFGSSFSFNRFVLYFKKTRHKQNVLAGNPELGLFLRNIFFQAAGLKFSYRAHKSGVSLVAEKKIYQTDVIYYNQINLKNAFYYRLTDLLILISRFSYVDLTYPDFNERMLIRSAKLQMEWSPTGVFSIGLYTGLRKQQRTNFADQQNFEYGGKAQWSWRTMRLSITYRAQDWVYDQRKTVFNHFTIDFERFF